MFNHGFFVDGAPAGTHCIAERRIPGRSNRCAPKADSRRCFKVISDGEPPRTSAEALDDPVGDLNPWPVEITVVRDSDTGRPELPEQKADRGLWLPLRTQECAAARTQAVCRCGDNAWVFTAEDHASSRLERM